MSNQCVRRHSACWLPVTALLGLSLALSSCGGAGEDRVGGEGAPLQAVSEQIQLAPAAAAVEPGAFSVDALTMISETRISRTVFEYVFRVTVTNGIQAQAGARATLAAIGAGTTVVDGEVHVGDMAPGATLTLEDTITLRHDRSVPFDPGALVWTIRTAQPASTSFDLIDKALADGLIDAETSLLYKVYAEFDDDRLPAQYIGRAIAFNEFNMLGVAEGQWSALTPATRQPIAPFLLPPDVAGSWYALRASSPLERPLRAGRAAGSSWTPDWQAVDGDPTKAKVRVWWDAGNAATSVQDGLDAIRIRDEIDSTIWPRLTQLLGTPMPDAGGEFEGGDGRLDILLVRGSGALTRSRKAGCQVHVPGVITLGQGVYRSHSTVAHELTHAILLARTLQGGCGNFHEYGWMHEASATWAEHFVYPAVNFEHRTAPWFLERPEVELEMYEPQNANNPHQYGAYLWFLYLTRGVDAGAGYVSAAWNAAAGTDSLRAIQAAIGSLGGFAEVWPKFVLRNWNRVFAVDQPYRDYYLWDKLDARAKEEVSEAATLGGKASATYSLAHRIPHLAARYYHYDFTADNANRPLTFTHPYWGGQESTAKVQAIVKMRGQDWRSAEDWTAFSQKSFCRDKPTEDVEELVIVISNSNFADRNHVLQDTNNSGGEATQLKVSAFGCSPWIGSVQFDYADTLNDIGTHITVSETASATNVVFELVDGDDQNGHYEATGGVVNWRHSGTANLGFGSLQCAGDAAGTFLVSAGYSSIDVSTFSPPYGDGVTLSYSGVGEVQFAQLGTDVITYACNVPERYAPQGQLAFRNWLMTNALIPPATYDKVITDADGNLVLRGDVRSGPFKWHWEFKQLRTAR